MPRRWIQRAVRHKGALHRMLGIAEGQRIPPEVVREAAEHPERFYAEPHKARLLQRRARFALNVRGLRRRRSAKR